MMDKTVHVNKHTEAGCMGKEIVCPGCGVVCTVYHFSWAAQRCQHCSQMIDKEQWEIKWHDKNMIRIKKLLKLARTIRRHKDRGNTVTNKRSQKLLGRYDNLKQECTEEEWNEYCRRYSWDRFHSANDIWAVVLSQGWRYECYLDIWAKEEWKALQ